jgi:hypothetical protein
MWRCGEFIWGRDLRWRDADSQRDRHSYEGWLPSSLALAPLHWIPCIVDQGSEKSHTEIPGLSVAQSEKSGSKQGMMPSNFFLASVH